MIRKKLELFAYPTCVFIIVFFLILFIKYSAITSQYLIQDDLNLFPESIFGGLMHKGIYFSVYSAINTALVDPAAVRLFYLIIYSANSLLLASILILWDINKFIACIISILAFLNPTTAIFPLVINASYNIIFLFLYLIGALILSSYLKYPSRSSYFLCAAGSFFVAFSIWFSSSAVLIPFAIIFLPFYFNKEFKKDKNLFITLLIILTAFIISGLIRAIWIIYFHPYSSQGGKLIYKASHILEYSLYFITSLSSSIWNHNPSMSIGSHLNISTKHQILYTIAFISISLVLILFNAIKAIRSKDSLMFRSPTLRLFPFFTAAFIFSLAPLTVNKGVQQWHFFLPGLFFYILVGLLITLIIKRKVMSFMVITIIVFLEIASLSKISKLYESYALQCNEFHRFIQSESSRWVSKSAVVILGENIPDVVFESPSVGLKRATYILQQKSLMRTNKTSNNVSWGAIASEKFLPRIVSKDMLMRAKNVFVYKYNFLTGDFIEKDVDYIINMPSYLTSGGIYFEKIGKTIDGLTKYHYHHDPEAKQRLWIHSIEQATALGDILKASLRVTSNKKMKLSASLARQDTKEPYEGTARTFFLKPGVETLIEVAHTFKQPRKNLKIQLDIKECDGDTAEITIRDIQISKSQ